MVCATNWVEMVGGYWKSLLMSVEQSTGYIISAQMLILYLVKDCYYHSESTVHKA